MFQFKMFIDMLLGHLVGDYLLQNNWMALSKHQHGFSGWARCFIHCCIYTICIISFTGILRLDFAILVFLSHFIIDKFSIAEYWLKLIGGRSIKEFVLGKERTDRHIIMRGGFTSFVYISVDNTLHFLIMWYGAKLLKII